MIPMVFLVLVLVKVLFGVAIFRADVAAAAAADDDGGPVRVLRERLRDVVNDVNDVNDE